MNTNKYYVLFIFFIQFLFLVPPSEAQSVTQNSIDATQLTQVIKAAQQNLLKLKIADAKGEYWSMPGYLGSHYVSQYYLFTKWFGLPLPQQYKTNLLNLILRRQNQEQGFWLALDDANLKTPNAIDPTIYHYWALKVLRTEYPERQAEIDIAMDKAKQFILAQGGAENSVLFTKVVMALFGNYSWDHIPYIPSLTYHSLISPLVVSEFSQWVIPHLKPLGYIRAHRITKNNLGPEFTVRELFAPMSSTPKPASFLKNTLAWMERVEEKPDSRLHNLSLSNWAQLVETQIVPQQKPAGSWGGYTLSTIFSLITMQHHYGEAILQRTDLQVRFQRGVDFLETLYFKTGDSSYQGVLDDGSYWDTALALRALRETGIPDNVIMGPAQFLANLQQANGAFPFGYDFEDYSDVDDTAETILALRGLPLKNYQEKKALRFLVNFQNRDSGWGTFDKNNTGNFLLEWFTKDFKDSAEMFDISRPDVTGHSLEIFGAFGYTKDNSFMVARALQYLRSVRDPQTKVSWLGRWGVNHIFGTSAVITGMRAVGVSSQHPIVRDALTWIKSIQNSDGGFGETTESYRDVRLLGANQSVSTASQTAWALLALIDGGERNSVAATRAVQFLMDQFETNGRQHGKQGFWTDPSVTGTGHPGLIYMVYPSYPYTWPLIALGKYLREQH